jgi:hypothetical protein
MDIKQQRSPQSAHRLFCIDVMNSFFLMNVLLKKMGEKTVAPQQSHREDLKMNRKTVFIYSFHE